MDRIDEPCRLFRDTAVVLDYFNVFIFFTFDIAVAGGKTNMQTPTELTK